MKKLLCAVLTLAMTAALLSGCSLFSSGGGEDGGESDGSAPIKITDAYTFENPAGLEFEKRYVVYGDENCTVVSSSADYGMKAIYMIAYATADDGAAGLYTFMIVDSAENAQRLTDYYATQGQALTAAEEDPCVLYTFSDGETMEASLVMMQSLDAISEATVSMYVEWFAANTGAAME